VISLGYFAYFCSGANAVDVQLLCANQKTFEIRTSNVIDRCTSTEFSLEEGPILLPSLPVIAINQTLEIRFKSAQASARKEGIELKIVSGFRTLERQKYLFNQAVKKYGSYKEAAKWVAPAHVSHHPLGLAIDVNYPNEPAAAKWLEVNGYKFGLCRTFKNEWWHFEGNIAPGWKCPKMLKDARALLSN
jgi:D-alanyl-D-alanine carboxypeptidase